MQKIIFRHPGKIVFGESAAAEFVQDCIDQNISRLYVLTIEPLLGHVEQMLAPLKEQGVEWVIDMSVTAEPSFSEFEEILSKAKDFHTDGVVGIGGGSVMDTAKFLAAQIKNTQAALDVVGIGLLKERQTWLACLPTTSGTGSEVSPNAIFLDETDGGKKGVISPFLVPDGAYIDPELSAGVPKAVTAATGIDALTHCLEAYANKFAHPMVDLFALEGIKLIAENLKQACDDGSNLEARAKVALGSVYGGMCLGPVNTGAVHALAYPLGSMFKVPHGLSNALMLPAVLNFNMEAAPERYADIAIALGAEKQTTAEATAKAGFEKLKALMAGCDMPAGLAAIDIPKESIPTMAKEGMKVQRLLQNNLREVTEQDAVAIYNEAY